MPETPCFPAWRHRLAPLGTRTAQAVRQVRAYTLCPLEKCFSPWVPTTLFPKAPEKTHSRDRDYTRWRTFWCLLWPGLNAGTAGREVLRQLQALFRLEEGPQLSENGGAYCRAKARLPLDELPKALLATAQAADQQAAPVPQLQDRPLKVLDGSAVTVPDTRKNRAAYPPLQCADKPSFPRVRLGVVFSLLSGAIVSLAQGSLGISELALAAALVGQLTRGDIVLGDRGLGCYPFIALLWHSLGVDVIGRTTRRIDGRKRLRRLGKNDWLIRWKKSATASPWLTALQGAGRPDHMDLRAVKGRCSHRGLRVRQVTVVTPLLDPQLYRAQEILGAYLRRWRLEMCLDDLKTTLQMDLLRGKSPAMVQRELYVRLIRHNLIRCLMAQAATEHAVALERLSFKGSLDAVRQFAQALALARAKKKRQRLWADLLQILATDLVPERPGRREPRAVKRKKNKYPRLNVSRRKFRDHPKRNVRRTKARLRRLGLM